MRIHVHSSPRIKVNILLLIVQYTKLIPTELKGFMKGSPRKVNWLVKQLSENSRPNVYKVWCYCPKII